MLYDTLCNEDGGGGGGDDDDDDDYDDDSNTYDTMSGGKTVLSGEQ